MEPKRRNGHLSIAFVVLCLQTFISPSLEAGAKRMHTQRRPAASASLKLLDKMLRNYDRRSTPTNDLGLPTNVSVELHVASLGSINTENMDYTTDTYLRQRWVDQRMIHENMTDTLDLADPALVKAIWKPEVFFPNAKEAVFQFVTVPNVLVRIQANGEILYILRLRLKFSCMMELSRYPLDRQICGMQIASFSKTTRELQLFWSDTETPVSVASDLKMPQFTIEKVSSTTCNEQFHLGNYSCLVAQFHMKRSISFHLIQSYLPSILIVAISWVSFWMDLDSVPGRISLGVITMLAVSGQAGVDKNVPQTSYVKAIDVWMGLCTAFVFSALVEFTIVNFWFRKQRQQLNLPNLNVPKCAVNNRNIKTEEANHSKTSKYAYQDNTDNANTMLKSNYLCNYHQKLQSNCGSTNRKPKGNLKCAHEYVMDIDADAFCASLMPKFISRGEILSEETKSFREDNGNECGEENEEANLSNEKSPLLEMREEINHVSNNEKRNVDDVIRRGRSLEMNQMPHHPEEAYCNPESDNKSSNALEMMSKHETEMDDRSHNNSNSIGFSFNNIKRAAERCKSKYKSTSIIKSLSSYSTCTEGEKYFTNSKGEHYFYTRTGNKHLFVPTENVLKDNRVGPMTMTRSHTCHDNPLFLWDEKKFCSKTNAKDEENTLDIENNHSTNSLTSNTRMHFVKAAEAEDNLSNNCNLMAKRKLNETEIDDKYSSLREPLNAVKIEEQQCVLCELSHHNQNNFNKMHGFSTAMVPAGDGVYRTIYRGPSRGSRNAKKAPFSKQNHNMQGLFESSQAGSTSHANESVTYCHPAELVDQACRGLFPLGFLLCNCIYWVYYLYIAEDLSATKYPH